MTTGDNTQREIKVLMVGSGGDFRSRTNPYWVSTEICSLSPKWGGIVFDRPVRFEIAGEFKEVSVFIQFTRGCFSFLFFFFQLLFADEMTGGMHQSDVNSHALVEG